MINNDESHAIPITHNEHPASKQTSASHQGKPLHSSTRAATVTMSPELIKALRVCVRAYGIGYMFATAPKLIKTLLAFLMNPRKATPKGQNPIAAFLIAIATVIKDGTSSRRDGMSMLLLISLGGYKILELFLNRGMKKAILAQQLQRQKEQHTHHQHHVHHQKDSEEVKWTKDNADKIELTPALRQRITMMASFVSSAAAIIFMHRYRPNHATIDYSLFAVVRALDVFGHVAVKNQWGPKWLGSYGSLAVFVISCTEIMYSWMYEPERLPGPYAFWITKMSRMDKRLLTALRAVRSGSIKYGQPNTPELRGMLMNLCTELNLDPKLGDIDTRQKIHCLVVHQNIAHSCEVHTGYRWIQGFLVSSGIYLPVHLLPALINPKAFIKKLKEDPVGTITSTLLSAARSSAFLATYIALSWYGICFWRSRIIPLASKLSGKTISGNITDNVYGALLGAFLCGFSVQIEKPHRRAEMALYVLPRALYAMYSRLMLGRLNRKVEIAGEVIMYATSMSVLLTGMMWSKDMLKFWKTYFTPDRYSHDQVPDQTGKVVIVTGANTGLGYALTVALAGNGAHVILACHNKERAFDAMDRAKAEIKERYPRLTSEPKLEFLELDLNDMNKTRQAAKEFLARNLPLHTLICNAGINLVPFGLSADGIETQFAVNYLGHYVFTMTLLERLKETKPSRVVFTSSVVHEVVSSGEHSVELLNDETFLDPELRYNVAKLAAVQFAKALARRLEKESVFVNVCHPGLVQTDLNRRSAEVLSERFNKNLQSYFKYCGVTPRVGCLTQLYLATSPEIEEQNIRGRYFIPVANEIDPHPFACNTDFQDRLLELSETLVRKQPSTMISSYRQAQFWKSFVTPARYSHDQIPDQTGKVAIVTGANTGLGYATAKTLAAHGAHVFLACRNKEKGTKAIEKAKAEIKEQYPRISEPKLEFLELDLNDMQKTRQAAKNFLSKGLPLHILVCNAGIMLTPFGLSADGIENQFAVNHMGHFVFTMTLLNCVKESQPSRIVILSSNAHEATPEAGIDLDAINDQTKLTSFERYYRSKLANVLFANALARRLEKDNVYVNSLNPGYVNTELSRYAHDVFGTFFVNTFNTIGNALVAMKPEYACLTPVYLATSPDIENQEVRGRYFIPIAHEIHPSLYARDEVLQEKFWTFSENLVREKIGEI
ncbi:hypothetical protein BGX27_006581 [Mortierella sp. AM989]|nr:hypothetical protein BGX27_006581 [Mortierella sp. AM989]